MPITFSFDQERGLVLAKVTGKLNLEITEEYFQRLSQRADCPENAIEIVDFSGVTDFQIQYGDMQRITMTYQNTKSSRNIRATIFVSADELSYGIARMLQTIHGLANAEHLVKVARSENELQKYLTELKVDRS